MAPPPSTARYGLLAPYGLHWFRRDLRVAGNPALGWSAAEHGGRVLGLFCVDARLLARPDFSVDRFAFFLATLRALRDELRALGGDLLVLDEGPEAAFGALMAALDRAGVARPATVSWNRDYEPFARTRDAAISKLLVERLGVAVHTERDHLILEPEEMRFFQVYSPFARRWIERLDEPEIRARIDGQQRGLAYLAKLARGAHAPDSMRAPPFRLTWRTLFGDGPPPVDKLESFSDENARRVRVPIPPAGSVAALARLRRFTPRLAEYKGARDLPSLDGTSRLSMYFKNGSLTPAQVIAALEIADATFAEGTSRSAFLREIVWREFYYHVLWHRPDVEAQAFLPQFRKLRWQNREDWFEAWKAGRTGYPLVDAGMRQLAETGWMHNRVRMVVASFLTKDLLIDWRWGERYFMDRLLDGDLAPNNGGWQWAASTGCDPQPYFRIFNPTLQSQKFDPDGTYLRSYLPERKDDDRKAIHLPRKPIVDHAKQKVKALAMYKKAAGRK
jgi:deoxyribodipyrimidine photo-lyase